MPSKTKTAKKTPTRAKSRARKAPAQKKPALAERPKRSAAAVDAEHAALLRKRCLQAGAIGAASTFTQALPGMATASRMLLGDVLDASMLLRMQNELVEETFALYDFKLPATVERQLARAIIAASAGSATVGDLLARDLLAKVGGGVGGMVLRHATPLLRVATTAAGNIAVTYAVGRRAQAMARLGRQPIADLPEALRTFTGLDERRLLSWATDAVQSVLALGGGSLRLFGQGAKAMAAFTSMATPRRAKGS